ncbi:MAG: FHA domain-containing protein [Candidatus Omnitrophica bacterium]|nr:FHA domain-containing protein [Candidatus Omnitrophota bacterium]
MGKIVLEIDRHVGLPVEYRVLELDCIRIGRAFDNDVIVSDPFVDARHLCIRSVGGALECEDLGSVNGTFLADRSATGARTRVTGIIPLASGDTISLGKTVLRVWDGGHPVEPARRLPDAGRHEPGGVRQALGWQMFLSLLLFYAVFYFVYYREASKQEIPVVLILAQETSFLIVVAVWSGIWALITRFSRRQHMMARHFLFSCQWSVLLYVLGLVLKYVFFMICNQATGTVLSFLIFGLAGSWVLDVHMAMATNLPVVRRRLLTGGITCALLVLAGLFQYGARYEFDSEPKHYINLAPLPERMIPTIPVTEEIRRLDDIFQKESAGGN